MTNYAPYTPGAPVSTPPHPEADYYPGMSVPNTQIQALQPYAGQPYGVRSVMEHPQAGVVLALGIAGFFVALTGPIAWYLGNKATKECDAGLYRSTDMLRVGRILGIITTILMIVGVVVGIVGLMLFGIFVNSLSDY